MKIFYFLLIGMLSYSIDISAQILPYSFNEELLQIRVKQLDEFIKRFNYKIDIYGNRVLNKDTAKIRRKYILNLFDQELFKKDSVDFNRLDEFIKTITDTLHPKYINFLDTNWYAEVKCKSKYKGKTKDLILILKTEKRANNFDRWVIESAKSDFLIIKSKEKDSLKYISPVCNEINFMDIPTILKEDNENITNYISSDIKQRPINTFIYLIKNKELTIEYIYNIKYHFLQIPEWLFTVEHIEREGYNVGWLITSFSKLNSKEKTKFKDKLLYKLDK